MARLSDEERENLVAYLDGELDEATAHALETRLNLDPEARAEADAMQQTWGLLDYLPKPAPSVSFTHRTLERLAVQTAALPRSRVPRWLMAAGWAAAVLVALVAGLGAGGWLWPTPQPKDDTEFIKALSHPDLFGEEAADHSAPPAEALAQVRVRYAYWLERLEPTERTKIEQADDREARVKTIRDLREQEWLNRQPRKFREELVSLQGGERSRRINEQRREERQRRHDRQIADRFWGDLQAGKPMEARLSEFPNDVKVFVEEYLLPQLSPQDQERLKKAEGQWPLYPKTLVELADGHPMALLNPEYGPKSFKELPKEVQRIVQPGTPKKGAKREFFKETAEANGAWPAFAIAVAKYARKNGLIFPNELWPNNLQALCKDAKNFVTDTLMPVLDDGEKRTLAKAESRGWPDYPRVLNELARAHRLEVPWQTLPEPRKWDPYRTKKITPD